jgi:hypothetical protein
MSEGHKNKIAITKKCVSSFPYLLSYQVNKKFWALSLNKFKI